MAGFVNRINTAHQSEETSTVRHCGVYQNKTIRCGVCSIPMQNPFSSPLIDSKRKGFQKSEIGLEIERSDTSSDRVRKQ